MLKKIIFGFSLFALVFSCSSSDESTISSSSDGFDRSTMLTNWADNIIIPAYQDLDAKLVTLKADKDTFIATPNQTNLETLRTSWLNAYKVWQYVEMFDIGKAEEISYKFQMNVYPVTVADIKANIDNQNYDLSHPNNNDAVGFPALDYLLYGVDVTDADILVKYTDVNYQNYLSDVIDQMVLLTDTVLSDWTSNYRATFVSSIRNTATSSVNKLVNDFIYYYEKGLRANKIGIPAGVFSSTSLSTKVEGFYSKQYSKVLAEQGLKAVKDFFNGKNYNSTLVNSSFYYYLNYLDRASLVSNIRAKLDNGLTKIGTLNANFSSQVETDNVKMTETFDMLQLAVVSFKVDMIQAMNISVDFTDADGD